MKNFNEFVNEEEGKIISIYQPAGLLRKKMRTLDSSKVSYGYLPEVGLSVFAREQIRDGEIIEVCPLIILDKLVMGIDDLNDRVFVFDQDEETYALPLGYGALYNHDDEPNADWLIDKEKEQLRIFAVKAILPGEEITINFGESYWESRTDNENKEQE